MARALTVPSFVTQAYLWDIVTFVTKSGNRYEFETELDVDVQQAVQIDVKKPKGGDKARTGYDGADVGRVKISIVLITDAMLADYMALIDEVAPKDGKTGIDPVIVVHPAIAVAKLGGLKVQGRALPTIEKGKQRLKATLTCIEDSPPKKSAKTGPLNDAPDEAKVAALQAEVDALEARKKQIIQNGEGARAVEDVNKQIDAVRARYPKPPPSVSNTKP